SNVAMILAVVVLLITSQPMLAIVALAPLPLVNVLANRFSRRIHPAVLAVQAEQAQLATVVILGGFLYRAVQSFRAARLAREAGAA
ncbi:MAG: ABC transporter ATP-binding protein, partial [Actinobacteria bacterium]|nr:ABC transporter ATP-binding protein [Actinomycetota bacterium]